MGLVGGLNLYAYVNNNPLRYTDPLGLASLSGLKATLSRVHEIIGGSLPKGSAGKFGSPQRGDSIKGYRYDNVGHPKAGSPDEAGPHINWWDYSKGKRGNGGKSGAVPVPDNQKGGVLPDIPSYLIPWQFTPTPLGGCEDGSCDDTIDWESIKREFCAQNPGAPNCQNTCP